MEHFDVIVVGGGLAGLTAAIHLSRQGHHVLVFEKTKYPHHKVCGEYVSNEVIPYLSRLGVSLATVHAVEIHSLSLSTMQGRHIETGLPLGGKGISRYAFDDLLYRRALACDVHFQFQNVVDITYRGDSFEVLTYSNETYTSKLVVGAYGKRNGLDKTLNRDFVSKKSGWLAIKGHYEYDDFAQHSVALHSFNGGYGGLSMTETGAVNFCYLVSYASFRKQTTLDSFNANVVAQNPFLGKFLRNAVPIFEKPLTIAQISFRRKRAVKNHILMCGDTAGLIHPLCGNGMAMAIHSAKIAAELIDDFLTQDSHNARKSHKTRQLDDLEREYQKQWNIHFKKRLWMGRHLQALLLNPELSTLALSTLIKQPRILRGLIQNTHGKPIA
ncbi:MAG TPA: NAD(P)/FAD-dependent oxidoreductase [Pricia sp.]|nr:NAD(P)/FAD-dependent oxidoreductase [Pricia sp.]